MAFSLLTGQKVSEPTSFPLNPWITKNGGVERKRVVKLNIGPCTDLEALLRRSQQEDQACVEVTEEWSGAQFKQQSHYCQRQYYVTNTLQPHPITRCWLSLWIWFTKASFTTNKGDKIEHGSYIIEKYFITGCFNRWSVESHEEKLFISSPVCQILGQVSFHRVQLPLSLRFAPLCLVFRVSWFLYRWRSRVKCEGWIALEAEIFQGHTSNDIFWNTFQMQIFFCLYRLLSYNNHCVVLLECCPNGLQSFSSHKKHIKHCHILMSRSIKLMAAI